MDEQNLIQLIPELRDRSLTVTPLGGGLTNRNYRIDADGESYVLRVAGKDTALLGIDRACEVACARAAAFRGVGTAVSRHRSGKSHALAGKREDTERAVAGYCRCLGGQACL